MWVAIESPWKNNVVYWTLGRGDDRNNVGKLNILGLRDVPKPGFPAAKAR